MNKKRMLIVRILLIAVLVAIGAVMMVIGRGHTIYLDNKDLEANGQTYKALYKIEAYVDGERIAKLYEGERGAAVNIGQKYDMALIITETKGGKEVTKEIVIDLPYNMDGIAINLPGYLAGLDQDAYLTEFVPTAEEDTGAAEDGETIPGEEDFDMESFE